jgi:3-demethylubiquinone-9 3-methyltransferase
MNKNTICVWYDKDAEAAARFYAETFPDSAVKAIHFAPADFPGGTKGTVLTVEFTVCGIPCVGLNGGQYFRIRKLFRFKSLQKIRPKLIAIGMRLLATVERQAYAVGARINGASTGRLRPEY